MARIAKLEGVERVKSIRTPARLEYHFTAGQATSRFLRGIAQKHIFGERCGESGKVYVPPRGSDPVLGRRRPSKSRSLSAAPSRRFAS